MTLDRIHVDTIAHLASAIADGVDDSDYEEIAEEVWMDFLDPLYEDGRVVIEPLDEDCHERRFTPMEEAAVAERPFETTHGVDSGTMNPTSFKNGLVLDVAQAAMASDPSDLDLHRARTILVTVHTNDVTFSTNSSDWYRYDDKHSERRVLKVPQSRRFADETVHELALSLAESHHALEHADEVSELLILDGPLYPKRLLNWGTRDRDRRRMAHEEQVTEAVRNYVELVETLIEREVPVVGFVKNPTSGYITRTLSKKGMDTPWPDDTALFTRLLEQREDGERLTDALTFTSWFLSRGGADEPMSTDGDAPGVERDLDRKLYEVTFMMLYDPRTDVLFKVEAPRAFTDDRELRKQLTTQILSEVASEEGPPVAVSKADEIAGIGRGEKASLRRQFEDQFDSEYVRTYDDVRWPEE